jgi:chromosome segregation ATPase
MAGIVENAKGVVSIVRDGLITLILILLIMMPATVNKSLVSAGFVKGSIAGFEWEAVRENVENNNEKLGVATSTIDSLQEQLGKTQAALSESEKSRTKLADQVTATMPGTAVADMAASAPAPETREIVEQNKAILKNSEVRGSILRQQIQNNEKLLATVMRPVGM